MDESHCSNIEALIWLACLLGSVWNAVVGSVGEVTATRTTKM
jgi:hypothetical protein